MGIPLFSSDKNGSSRPGNPNPYRFEVRTRWSFGRAAVVKVNYPDCHNYEGNKILLYDDKDRLEKAISSGSLDPHFREGAVSPVARFEPTRRGWVLAVLCGLVLGSQLDND